jgi:regulator of sirC expression with transglutaminase-like and TPR domain
VAWFQRGLSLSLVEGGRPAALECLERATRIDPKLAPAWRARAGILAEIGGREAEVRMCEERAAALERGVP